MSVMMSFNGIGGGGGGGGSGLSGSGGSGGGGVPTSEILYPDSECVLPPQGTAPGMLDSGTTSDPLQPLHFPEYHLSGAAALPSASGGGGIGGAEGSSSSSSSNSSSRSSRGRRRRTPPRAMFDINDNSLYSVYCFFKSLLSASTASTVAIDNKIEQAMDLVKSHLMFAVREEVEVLKEKITELLDRISQLEYENMVLRQYATQEALQKIQQHHASNT